MTQQEMTLEQRLQRLEDIEAVRDTWHEYMLSLDAGAWDALLDVFTEDANFEVVGFDPELFNLQPSDLRHHGRDAIVNGFYRKLPGAAERAARKPGARRVGHHGTDLRVSLNGDEAGTIAYFLELDGSGLVFAGTYEHRMRREPDRWRIASMRATIIYTQQLTVANLVEAPLDPMPTAPMFIP